MDGFGPAINYLLVGTSGHDLSIPSTLSVDDELDDLMVTPVALRFFALSLAHWRRPLTLPRSVCCQVVVTPTAVNIFCAPANWNHIQNQALSHARDPSPLAVW